MSTPTSTILHVQNRDHRVSVSDETFQPRTRIEYGREEGVTIVISEEEHWSPPGSGRPPRSEDPAMPAIVFGTKGEALFSQSGNCTTDGRPFGVDTSRGSVWLPPNFPTGGLGLETSALETCASTQSEASRRPQSTARLEVVDRTKITCPGCGGGRGCSHCGYRGWVWHSLVDCPLCHSAVSVVDGEPELCDCQKYQQAREEDVR